jgi:hypothetical protein
MGVTSLIGVNYENKPRPGLRENKPKQSQFHTPELPKGVGKREKSLVPANSLTG